MRQGEKLERVTIVSTYTEFSFFTLELRLLIQVRTLRNFKVYIIAHYRTLQTFTVWSPMQIRVQQWLMTKHTTHQKAPELAAIIVGVEDAEIG